MVASRHTAAACVIVEGVAALRSREVQPSERRLGAWSYCALAHAHVICVPQTSQKLSEFLLARREEGFDVHFAPLFFSSSNGKSDLKEDLCREGGGKRMGKKVGLPTSKAPLTDVVETRKYIESCQEWAVQYDEEIGAEETWEHDMSEMPRHHIDSISLPAGQRLHAVMNVTCHVCLESAACPRLVCVNPFTTHELMIVCDICNVKIRRSVEREA